MIRLLTTLSMAMWASILFAQDGTEFVQFKHHVVNAEAGTGLAITVADINGDGRMDIVGASSKDVVWYENPEWTPHLMTGTLRGSNVCIAGYDLDGDGVTEFALGADWQFNNTAAGGALYLLKSSGDVNEPWDVIPLLNEEPTLHRIRWVDVEGDGTKELLVAPLKGIGTTGPLFQERGVKLFLLRPGEDPFETPWKMEIVDESLHVLHNVWPVASENKGDTILAASFEGITAFTRAKDGAWSSMRLTGGNPEERPNSGAGEIKSSEKLRTIMYATIEPWHGHQAVVYTKQGAQNALTRTVLDAGLKGGHAIWWADFDGDGRDELLVGFRDKAPPKNLPGLNIYKAGDDSGTTWTKHVVDDGGMATEDALAADMNGDGRIDIVAFGRATHNIKYYENLGTSGGN